MSLRKQATGPTADLPTLRMGNRGPDVERLQTALNATLGLNLQLRVDGSFGRRTEAAVRRLQATLGLAIDGIVGPRTWAALQGRSIAPPALPSPSYPNAPWMEHGFKEVGQAELRGDQHNPRILEYHATTGLGARTDEVPWCSSFVNWALRQANIGGTNSAAAVSWLRWGVSSIAQPGAIAVIYNPEAHAALSSSGNHVGFLTQQTGSHYFLLGGNQSNQVKISPYPSARWQLKGYRWPTP